MGATKTRALHYSGAICYDTARSTAHILGGYAACCSGDKTRKLRSDGLVRHNPEDVTCKRCLTILAKRVDCKAHSEE